MKMMMILSNLYEVDTLREFFHLSLTELFA